MCSHDIDISDERKYNNNFLSGLSDTFSLQDIIIGKTWHKSNRTSIDKILTDIQRSFHKTSIFATSFDSFIFLFLFHDNTTKNYRIQEVQNFRQMQILHDLDQELLL